VTLRLSERYRKRIEDGLDRAIRRGDRYGSILRYHVGLEDERGAPQRAMGKLLRPSLVLFVAEELGADPAAALPAAVGIELVHNFSLIHDDIQDRDRTRRGRPTVWSLHGEAQAINAGDLMFALAIGESLRSGPEAARLLVDASTEMIEGQFLDLGNEGCEISIEEYRRMIDRKTGALLRCALRLGARIAGASSDIDAALLRAGLALGRAFQVRDDLLGVWGDEEVTGKPEGSDIRRKKNAYPIVAAIAIADGGTRARLAAIYRRESLNDDDVAETISLFDRLDVRASGEREIDEQLAEAHDVLAEVPLSERGREELSELIGYLARRNA